MDSTVRTAFLRLLLEELGGGFLALTIRSYGREGFGTIWYLPLRLFTVHILGRDFVVVDGNGAPSRERMG